MNGNVFENERDTKDGRFGEDEDIVADKKEDPKVITIFDHSDPNHAINNDLEPQTKEASRVEDIFEVIQRIPIPRDKRKLS